MNAPPSLHFKPFLMRQAQGLAGAVRSMLTLTAQLASRGKVVVVTLEDDALAEAARQTGADVVCVRPPNQPIRFKPAMYPESWRIIHRAAKRHGVKILHSHAATGCRHMLVPAKSARLPLVCHQRDNYAPGRYYWGMRGADRIISISRWVESTLPPHLARKSTVVHNAVDAAGFDPSDERLTPLRDAARLRVGFAGQCRSNKGPDLLAAAGDRILGSADNVELHIWGVPPAGGDAFVADLRSRLDTLSSRFPGRVVVEPFRKDVDVFFRSMDIVAIPSRFPEPFGRVSIEAMAYGAAVVAANHGGLPEVVLDGETGLVFEPGSADDLGEKVCTLIADPDLRRRFAEAGTRRAREHFDAESHVDRVLEVYRSLLHA